MSKLKIPTQMINLALLEVALIIGVLTFTNWLFINQTSNDLNYQLGVIDATHKARYFNQKLFLGEDGFRDELEAQLNRPYPELKGLKKLHLTLREREPERGQGYRKLQDSYNREANRILRVAKEVTQTEIKDARSARIKAFWLDIAALFSLGMIWLFTRRMVKRWERSQKESEQKLKDLATQHELVLNSAGEGIYRINQQGKIVYINLQGLETLGYDLDEVLEKSSHELFHYSHPDGRDYPKEDCPIFQVLTDGKVRRVEEDSFWTKEGQEVPVKYTAAPLYEDNQVSGVVVVFADVSESREVEKAKREFISMVSHELRTPLTSIRGSLGMLRGEVFGELPPEWQRMLDIASSNTERLIKLINDILDIERMESGRVEMERTEQYALTLATNALGSVEPLAHEASIKTEFEVTDHKLYLDADRISQALINLLSNAIKFSEPGSTVILKGYPQDRSYRFEVADQGRGIPADRLEMIFEKFQQVDASDARDKGGTGLGLPISRSIVEQHGGKLWAESLEGEGSRFIMELPILTQQQGRVLIVEDDQNTRETVAKLLSQRGYQTIEARDAKTALELACKEVPDLVLVDLVLPEISGFELINELKELPETASTPVVILSALRPSPEELKEHQPWLTKPWKSNELLEAIEAVISPRSQVLIVEDDPDLAELLKELFTRRGLQSKPVATAHEAIEYCKQHRPDFILLDLGLPDARGSEVIDYLKREGLNTPVMLYTAEDITGSELSRMGYEPLSLSLKALSSPEEVAKGIAELLSPKDLNQESEKPSLREYN